MSILTRLLGKEEEPEPERPESKRMRGTITWLDRGWGFIVSRDIEYTRIFFHWSGLNQGTLHFTELKKGMRVEFEVRTHPKRGYKAVKIEVVR
jgi:cold shock CspA family protein